MIERGYAIGGKTLYRPTPKQLVFHNAAARNVLYGGAAGVGATQATSHYHRPAEVFTAAGQREEVIERGYGDQLMFEAAWAIFLPELKRYLRSREDIPVQDREDAIQDVALKAWRAFDPTKCSNPVSAVAFIRRIAKRYSWIAVSRPARKRSRHYQHEVSVDECPGLVL